ncbi:paraquat-inducible protein A [Pseudooceanicola sp.]|uniref:paraquat-inducible protein A n=1 Tax=Pseudooceanicola sp. TaxID=1914328 RepID=UPI002608E674|nr:paraquat-inducible protein A [Pseudooceanicola sp.]MDF1856018.1 paraquat-inducible protein A [Pseudooceanicola sp.]
MEITGTVTTARAAGLIACRRCTTVWPAGTATCGRCGHAIASRDQLSLQKVWAWWIVGVVCYVPANVLPMLQTRTLGMVENNTIIGGAAQLADHGNWGVAIVILVASVMIPIGKFAVIAALAISVRHGSGMSQLRRQHLFELVEYIGRWSMIDVFVVALLSSLVQLGALAAVAPGPASLYFAMSVVFTMLSAQSFDSRMIWDPDTIVSRADRLRRLPGQPG